MLNLTVATLEGLRKELLQAELLLQKARTLRGQCRPYFDSQEEYAAKNMTHTDYKFLIEMLEERIDCIEKTIKNRGKR